MLNRCVTHSDPGLTWEADPRHAELAVAGLGLQAARPQASPGGAKPSAPLDHEELEPDGQKSLSQQVSKTGVSGSRPTTHCIRLQGVQSRSRESNTRRLDPSEAYRTILHTPRAVSEFPLQNEKDLVTIDGLSDADAAGCLKTRRSTFGGCLRVGQHTLATWSSTEEMVSLSSAESEHYSIVRCAVTDTVHHG